MEASAGGDPDLPPFPEGPPASRWTPMRRPTHTSGAHVTEGSWIGYGDPAPGFTPDFEPLSRDDEKAYRARFQWLGEDISEANQEGRPAEQLGARSRTKAALSATSSRTSPTAEPEYLPGLQHRQAGRHEGGAAGDRVRRPPMTWRTGWLSLWRLLDAQLGKITPEIREGKVQRGEKLWTAPPRLPAGIGAPLGSTCAKSRRRLGIEA